jgi:hypothetical protein
MQLLIARRKMEMLAPFEILRSYPIWICHTGELNGMTARLELGSVVRKLIIRNCAVKPVSAMISAPKNLKTGHSPVPRRQPCSVCRP